jgi:hypothetical protein
MHDIQIHYAERQMYSHKSGLYFWPCDERIIHIQRELSDDQLKRIVDIVFEEEEDAKH